MNVRRGGFSRVDLAILGFSAICGVLATLAADREFLTNREWFASAARYGNMPGSRSPTWTLMLEALTSRTVHDFEAVLYSASPGLALIAYRPRRGPRPRRRGPGHVALAVAGGWVCYGLIHFCWFTFGPSKWTGYTPNLAWNPPSFFWSALPRGVDHAISYAIVAAWCYLALIRGWRAPSLPLERSGRWLGLAWIVASVVSWGVAFIPQV